MAVSKEDILETIANMSVMEVVDLISAMEEKFGVSAACCRGRRAPIRPPPVSAAAARRTDEFDVVMTSFGENKVGVIKTVRAHHRSGPERGQGHGRRRALDDSSEACAEGRRGRRQEAA
jgi:ribosomal protein L7/L12